ncbi:MAG: sulfatase, partial [Halobacteriovoraceae bacterium]|nr:sulfatase [Halobacteriovoraceae bacterium]
NGKNVLILSIDALSANHLKMYGHYRNTFPKLEQFAKESLVFEKAFTAAGYTLASHVSLFTGLYPKNHKVHLYYPEGDHGERLNYKKTSISESIKTMGEYFSSLGYHAIWAVEPGNEQLNGKDSEGRGFNTFFRDFVGSIEKFEAWIESHSNSKFFAFFHSGFLFSPYFVKASERNLESFDNKHPFLSPNYQGAIISNFNEAQREYFKKYPEQKGQTHNHYKNFFEFWWSRVDRNNPEDLQHLRDLYDEKILLFDEHFERLISLLKKKNLYDNTVIIVISDHGESFGEHGYFDHAGLHQEVVWVPLIIRIPGVNHKKISTTVSLIDLYPTLVSMLSKESPHKMDGKDLTPIISETYKKAHDFFFFETGGTKAVSDGTWKLIKLEKENQPLMYNIIDDPKEQEELSLNHPDILKKLERQINLFFKDQ